MNVDVEVTKNEYIEILGFITFTYFSGKIAKVSGLFGGVRALGEYLENFVYGKIAEVALAKFLERELKIKALTDLDLPDFILGEYLPDIVAFYVNGNAFVPAEFWIEVKEVRREQKWFLVSASSVRKRPYDAYVAVWVGLPDEHVAWLVSNVDEARKKMSEQWKEKIRNLSDKIENIPCRVLGFVSWEDVKNVLRATEGDTKAGDELDKKFGKRCWYYFSGEEATFDPEDPRWKGARVGENVGFFLKGMRTASDWVKFKNFIANNRRLVDLNVKPKKREIIEGFEEDRRECCLILMKKQLEEMQRRSGSLRRKESWFSQPLR
jgi:hypothetical protein